MKRIPCRKCAHKNRPLFIECELEKLEHGLTSYADFRPTLLTVLAHDIPHSECRRALIEVYDSHFDRGYKDVAGE